MIVFDEHLSFDPQTHTYFLDGTECAGLTKTLQDVGIYNYSFINQATLQRAAKFGSAAQKACELWDMGTLNMKTLAAPLVPYLESWIKFREEFGFVPVDIEKPTYSLRYRFACMPDRFGFITKGNLANKALACVEIKSGLLLPGAAIQTAAQVLARNEMNPGNKAKKRLVIGLREGSYVAEEFSNEADASTWLACLQIVNFKKQHNIK